jgi:hypothetical protein
MSGGLFLGVPFISSATDVVKPFEFKIDPAANEKSLSATEVNKGLSFQKMFE